MEKTYDLTRGKAARRLLAFFLPMLFTNALQQIYAFIDAAIVGKGLGDNALGAVGNLSSLWLLIIGFSMGMTNGFSVILAQSFGAGNRAAFRKAIAMSYKLCLFMAALLTALGCLLLEPMLVAMRTEGPIFQDSLLYGNIIFRGLAATVAYNLTSAILRAVGDSRTPLFALIISSAVNVALDWFAIFYLKTGVEGAAIATVLSQAVSAYICYRKIRTIEMARIQYEDFENDGSMIRGLLKNGISMACMNSVTAVGCIVVQGCVNGLGVAYTAAYSACSKYLNLFMLPSITAGFSLSAFAGQNYGAGKMDRIREGVRVCLVIALVSWLALGAVMCIFPRALAGLMLNGEDTVSLAAQYLRICGAALCLLNFLLVYRNCVQGMGYPLIPMYSGVLEMALRIPAIMLLFPRIGFRATACAEALAWVGALALNRFAYARAIRRTVRGPLRGQE